MNFGVQSGPASGVVANAPLRDSDGGSYLNRSLSEGVVAMNFWSFHCPECGVGDRELGHTLSAEEIYCIVCLDETERRVRLHRWEVVEIEMNLAA